MFVLLAPRQAEDWRTAQSRLLQVMETKSAHSRDDIGSEEASQGQISRRGFLGATGAAAFGATILPSVATGALLRRSRITKRPFDSSAAQWTVTGDPVAALSCYDSLMQSFMQQYGVHAESKNC
jgi:hypothetical protein